MPYIYMYTHATVSQSAGVFCALEEDYIYVNCKLTKNTTVVPVVNGHPRDQAKVSVHCRWPLIRGNLTVKCVGRGIDHVAVQGRWPLTTGVAQGRYYYYCRCFLH